MIYLFIYRSITLMTIFNLIKFHISIPTIIGRCKCVPRSHIIKSIRGTRTRMQSGAQLVRVIKLSNVSVIKRDMKSWLTHPVCPSGHPSWAVMESSRAGSCLHYCCTLRPQEWNTLFNTALFGAFILLKFLVLGCGVLPEYILMWLHLPSRKSSLIYEILCQNTLRQGGH